MKNIGKGAETRNVPYLLTFKNKNYEIIISGGCFFCIYKCERTG